MRKDADPHRRPPRFALGRPAALEMDRPEFRRSGPLTVRRATPRTLSVRVPGRQPHSDARRNRDHRSPKASSTRRSASASTSRSTRTRRPPLNLISITPARRRDLVGVAAFATAGASGTIATGINAGARGTARSHRFGGAIAFILMAATLILTAAANLIVQQRYRSTAS